MLENQSETTSSQKFILQYIESERHYGALLVDGRWGSGKTSWLKSIKESMNSSGDYAIVLVSLFGLESSEELKNIIKKEVCYTFSSPSTPEEERKNESKLLNGLKALTGAFKDANQYVSAVDTIINLNWLDFIDLAPTIKGKKLVLIFDDIERCKIDCEILLGVLNNYCENVGIKVILIADENNISKDKYKDIKEKVIFSTVSLEMNYRDIISNIIDQYNPSGSNYQRFLKENIDSISTVFNNSVYCNLRSVKYGIFSF